MTVALVLAASASGACKKNTAGSDGPSPAASGSFADLPKVALPPDAKTPGALLADPKLHAGGMSGVQVKVHGYARVLSPEKVSIGEAPDRSVPFVFCKGKVPAGLPTGAHVLAEGTFDDTGNITDCTVSAL